MAKSETVVWLSREQCAAISRLSVDRWNAAIRPTIVATKTVGRRVMFDGAAAVDAIVEHRHKPVADDMLVGESSPALERYRTARAGLAELDLEREQKTHVALADLGPALSRFTARLRQAGEILQRRFGSDASDILNDAIEEAADIVKNEVSIAR